MGQLEVITPADQAIHRAIVEAVNEVHVTMAQVEITIKKVLVAGKRLRAKREALGHGEWMAWVATNVTAVHDVTYHTVRNWIKLADFAEVRGKALEDAQTVRQAYILAGLLPESESVKGGKGGSDGNYLVHMTRLERSIQTQVQARPIDQWAREDKAILKKRLQWFVDLYEQLDAA